MKGKPPFLVVLRHSVRMDALVEENVPSQSSSGGQEEDEIDNKWPDRWTRPWDTPISDYTLPRTVLDAAINCAGENNSKFFAAIYTSPFRRCLQTAAVAAVHFGMDRLWMHPGLGEVMHRARSSFPHGMVMDDPTGYLLTENDCADTVAIASGGKVSVVQSDTNDDGANNNNSTSSIPPWNETYGQSVTRLERTLQELQQKHAARQESILVVTHGDALQATATVFLGPQMNVYDLEYCALMAVDADRKLQCQQGLRLIEAS